MALTGETLIVAGPPDIIDEEDAFARLTARDPTIDAKLSRVARSYSPS